MKKSSSGMTQGPGKGGNMLAGMTRKSPPGDSGMRPPKDLIGSDPVRSFIGMGHTIGGREA